MTPTPNTTRRLLAAALAGVVLSLGGWTQDSPATETPTQAETQGQEQAAPQDIADRLPDLTAALFGDDEQAAAGARFELLLADLDHDAMVELARAADSRLHLAIARDIARHHVLTTLRHEELADLEDDTPLVGFQFQATPTAGQVGPDTDELVERFPFGAQVSVTTAGFPGYAHLRPGDMIVLIDGDPLPQDRLAAQQHVMNTVRDHTLDETVAMAVIRDGELVELSIPLARAAALPMMYNARTVSRDLIDPFLFLWDEAWSTIKLDAGYEEDVE